MFQVAVGCGNQRLEEAGGVSGVFDRIRDLGSRLGQRIDDLIGKK